MQTAHTYAHRSTKKPQSRMFGLLGAIFVVLACSVPKLGFGEGAEPKQQADRQACIGSQTSCRALIANCIPTADTQ